MNLRIARCWFACRKRNQRRSVIKDNKVVVKVLAPEITPSQNLVITGNQAVLGNWQPENSPVMNDSKFPEWSIEIRTKELYDTVEYKFCIIDRKSRQIIRWELGDNRILPPVKADNKITEIIAEPQFRDEHIKWRVAGTVIPVFALRTENSFGIGDFGDLLFFIDWLRLTSQHILQLLPVNDTTQSHTWRDSYPYNAISIYALHPLYLNLTQLGILNSSKRRVFYSRKQRELNALPEVDYEKVDRYKWKYFKEIFEQDGETTINSKEFSVFYSKNKLWLKPYAEFCKKRDKTDCAELYYFLQYHLHNQLSNVAKYAHSQGIALKGDIPIGISRDGVDAQTDKKLFNLDFQTGAPPDIFSPTGQNWGFPTYNWETMQKNGYRWWKNRFAKMSEYFDAYRIDHILGFFRIWEIPVKYRDGLYGIFSPALPYSQEEITGLPGRCFMEDPRRKGWFHPAINGRNLNEMTDEQREKFNKIYEDYFYRRNNDLWRENATEKLNALISSTDMLACGEDLGMIPDCVPDVMRNLQILSLEIERMSKEYGVEFTRMDTLPYLSVCTASTHDMDTVRMWWTEDRERTQRYYNQVLQCEGDAPEDCTAEICEKILARHLHSNSMMAIFSLQDWLSTDTNIRRPNASEERINIPAKERHYWRYRMHLNISDLMSANQLNEKIREMINQAGRKL
jgi:4-alpha-glucanotransferase